MPRIRPRPLISSVYRDRLAALAPRRATIAAGAMSCPSAPNSHLLCASSTTLRDTGYEAYLAGGCVRDLLLGREPADYDVATSATPDVVLEMFPRTFAVGAHFGVVLVATCGGADAAARLEKKPRPRNRS